MTAAATSGSPTPTTVTPTSPPPSSPPSVSSPAVSNQSVVLTAESLGTLLDVAEAAEERSQDEVDSLTQKLLAAKAILSTSSATTTFLRARLEELKPGETVTAFIQ
jgi:hypothetical protein